MDDGLKITFKDSGIPFNPLQKAFLNNQNIALDERGLGGLGLPIIHKFMDKIDYERKEHHNILELSKKF